MREKGHECSVRLSTGRVGFESDPHPTRLHRVNGKLTRGRPNVRVESDGAGRILGSQAQQHFKTQNKEIKKKIEPFLLTHHQNAQVRVSRGDFKLIRGGLWSLRLNEGRRVQRRRGNVLNQRRRTGQRGI